MIVEEPGLVIISGAERGLGKAIACLLAKEGYIILPTSRDIALSKAVVEEITNDGGVAFPYQLDIVDQESIDNFARQVITDFGRADILINNAGISIDTVDQPSNVDLQIVKETLDTNLFGVWRLCTAFLPSMREKNFGRIINISSSMGQLETMSYTSPAYRISKTSLNALTCMLAAEVEGTNITVNSVEPGWMRTEMGGPNAPRSPEQGADTVIWIAMMPNGGPNGGFYFNRKLIAW